MKVKGSEEIGHTECEGRNSGSIIKLERFFSPGTRLQVSQREMCTARLIPY